MRIEDSILVDGRVIEVVDGRLFRIELENGHRLMARVPRRLMERFVNVAAGASVTVEMSPFDLSRGIIAPPNGADEAKI